MSYTTLVEPEILKAHLDDPDWVIVDCRFSLADTEAGRRAYRKGHVPGAWYAHLDEDLSGPAGATGGRHPLPDPNRFAHTLGRWGIHENTQVVAYDDVGGGMAARLWWLLRWLGHSSVAVLNGGLPAWQQSGLPLATEIADPRSGTYPVRWLDALAWVDNVYVLANLERQDSLLIDARAAPRYRGEVEPNDPVAGHVPRAINLPWEANLDEQRRFRPAEVLKERFAAALGERPPARAVHMCGSGVTACHNLLAMEVAGLPGSRLYAGSWSEWVCDPARPVATGET